MSRFQVGASKCLNYHRYFTDLRHSKLDERVGSCSKTGKPDSRRLWYALGVRITFATLLLIAIGYGFIP